MFKNIFKSSALLTFHTLLIEHLICVRCCDRQSGSKDLSAMDPGFKKCVISHIGI